MMPMAAQSSLSHCTTERPGMVAGSSGTRPSSRPAQMTMPPECWPRWRGRSWMAVQKRAKWRMTGVPGSQPASRRWTRSVSPGSLYSQSLTSPDNRSQRAAGSAKTLPTSRAALLPR